MNRIQKKCLIATVGLHLLLVVILIVGPAFLTSHNQYEDLPVIEFIPMVTTDKPFSGGGAPTPPARPPQQQQVPTPAPRPQPPVQQVQKETPKLTAPENKPRKPQISTKVVTRSATSTTKPDKSETTSRNASSLSKELTEAAHRIRDASTSTEIEMPGVGDGGPSYANYAQVVKSAYMHAWIEPTGVDDDQATAVVSVTIANTGKVTSARIIQSSGNAIVDRAVQATLDRVAFIAPFPEGAKERERTYKLNFNLKANQLTG
jgi:protein TonB